MLCRLDFQNSHQYTKSPITGGDILSAACGIFWWHVANATAVFLFEDMSNFGGSGQVFIGLFWVTESDLQHYRQHLAVVLEDTFSYSKKVL